MLDNAHDVDGEQWYVAVSLVEAEERTWKVGDHFLLESTKDGGLGVWVRAIGEERMRLWKRGEKKGVDVEETGDWEMQRRNSGFTTLEKKLKARCHCGGVEFEIAPPRGTEVHDGLPESVTPRDKTKWYALNDVCTSCRLTSSCVVTSWAIVDESHITLVDGSPHKPIFGTMKAYKSSEEVDRTFCGTCGAIVSYRCDDRPSSVDVAVGLLEADSGVRAEEWLEWRTHRLAFEEDCKWENFLHGIKEGLRISDQGSQ